MTIRHVDPTARENIAVELVRCFLALLPRKFSPAENNTSEVNNISEQTRSEMLSNLLPVIDFFSIAIRKKDLPAPMFRVLRKRIRDGYNFYEDGLAFVEYDPEVRCVVSIASFSSRYDHRRQRRRRRQGRRGQQRPRSGRYSTRSVTYHVQYEAFSLIRDRGKSPIGA